MGQTVMRAGYVVPARRGRPAWGGIHHPSSMEILRLLLLSRSGTLASVRRASTACYRLSRSTYRGRLVSRTRYNCSRRVSEPRWASTKVSYAGNMVVGRRWGPPSSIMGPGIVVAAVVMVQVLLGVQYSTVQYGLQGW